MDFKIVRGRFLSLDKLGALLDANDLDISALVSGADRKLAEIDREIDDNNESVAKYERLVMEHTDKAESLVLQYKKLDSALKSLTD